MVREQKFRGKKLEFTKQCARPFKHDFVGSADHPFEIGSMILCYQGGEWGSGELVISRGTHGFPDGRSHYSIQLYLIADLRLSPLCLSSLTQHIFPPAPPTHPLPPGRGEHLRVNNNVWVSND